VPWKPLPVPSVYDDEPDMLLLDLEMKYVRILGYKETK
jgi:hypothetical protein